MPCNNGIGSSYEKLIIIEIDHISVRNFILIILLLVLRGVFIIGVIDFVYSLTDSDHVPTCFIFAHENIVAD